MARIIFSPNNLDLCHKELKTTSKVANIKIANDDVKVDILLTNQMSVAVVDSETTADHKVVLVICKCFVIDKGMIRLMATVVANTAYYSLLHLPSFANKAAAAYRDSDMVVYFHHHLYARMNRLLYLYYPYLLSCRVLYV